MNSHNAKTDSQAKLESVRIETDHDDVRVVKTKLKDAAELSISDDQDDGGDPYNSTGQHVILKIKRGSPD